MIVEENKPFLDWMAMLSLSSWMSKTLMSAGVLPVSTQPYTVHIKRRDEPYSQTRTAPSFEWLSSGWEKTCSIRPE